MTIAGIAFGVVAALILASCSPKQDAELVVVVTTDMSLPADMDWLGWTVTRAAHPDQHGSIALTKFDSLPGTLGLVSENGDAESVVVALDARTGGADGPVRVHREARLTMPGSGRKMLEMPLTWLCSAENQPAGCAPGMTCDAGQCVDSTISQPLADFVPLEKSPCFDVLDCNLKGAAWSLATPNVDPTTHDCIIDAHSVLSPPMSVALVVNPSLVGNAGVCSPSARGSVSTEDPAAGLCLVPVNQDAGPSGWRRVQNAEEQTLVQLPSAVCGLVDKVALTHNDCAAKTSQQPLCDAPSACVVTPSSCPSAFPATWTGYSCSGAASPSERDSSLKYCGISDTDPESGPLVRGHFCCTAGPSPGTDPLLIDDMSGGPLIKFPPAPNELAGNWFTASDDSRLPLSPPQQPKTLFTYRTIDPVTRAGEPSFDRAACFEMKEGFAGYYALEGFFFASDGVASVPLDVSQFGGITFWAMATPIGSEMPPNIGVFFPNGDTDTEHPSTCLQAGIKDGTGKTNCNHFRKPLPELTTTWQKFSARWDELSQATDFGMHFSSFDPHVYSVDFEALGPGPSGRAPAFDFCVSQIYFTP